MTHPFLDRLARGPILGDGAMGTMLHPAARRWISVWKSCA